MEYSVKQKTHIYDLIYPFAANLLGMKFGLLNRNSEFKVRYHANKYCKPSDNADNSMHKITVECDFGKNGKVYFIPSPMFDATVFSYSAYIDDDEVAKIGPYEWEVIRPKVHSDFTEYFSELSKATEAMQYLTLYKIAHPFILSHYKLFFQTFRETLYSDLSHYDGKMLPRAVEFVFNSSDIYCKPVHEQAFVSRFLDESLKVFVSSLN